MEGNISEMLQGVLNDPEAMRKLMGAAESLMGKSAGSASGEEEDAAAEGSASGATQTDAEVGSNAANDRQRSPVPTGGQGKRRPGNDERIALITALRPYLSEERRQTADNLVRILRMLRLADLSRLADFGGLSDLNRLLKH